jgi:calcium-dependent protein kinase
VITYILLCGFCPFSGETDCETLNLVKNGKLEFPSPEWDMISKDAVDFVRALLNRDPLARPTAAQALQHPWIAPHVVKPGIPPPRPFTLSKTSSNSDGYDRSISLSMDSTRCVAFRKYLAASKMRKALTRASMDLTPQEASLLGEVFAKVDQDKDGCITTSDLDTALKAPDFSSVVRRNLKQMKSHLIRYPSVTFDIRPFMPLVNRRAKSDSAPNL